MSEQHWSAETSQLLEDAKELATKITDPGAKAAALTQIAQALHQREVLRELTGIRAQLETISSNLGDGAGR
ncbi:hypothetical protein [Streptomyces sp. NPDC048248]|uniref:hypothetical protein n=1 Tax=Streptomyces sp. NPDC048248 TaxID=3365523 RepID=UPI00371BC71E